MSAPIGVFIAYARKDQGLWKQIDTHLATLKSQAKIQIWHDRQIEPGADWRGEIHKKLHSAQLILVLISADFLASPYCHDVELAYALKRHHAKEARVIPVILHPCEWQHSPIGFLQALPKDGKAVTKWSHRQDALADIARGVREAVEAIKSVIPPRATELPPVQAAVAPASANEPFKLVNSITDPLIITGGETAAVRLVRQTSVGGPSREIALIPCVDRPNALGYDLIRVVQDAQVIGKGNAEIFPKFIFNARPDRAADGLRWSFTNDSNKEDYRFALGRAGSFAASEFISESLSYELRYGVRGVSAFACLDLVLGALVFARSLARAQSSAECFWIVFSLQRIGRECLLFDRGEHSISPVTNSFIGGDAERVVRIGGAFDSRTIDDAAIEVIAVKIIL